jgi:hypothetical protein
MHQHIAITYKSPQVPATGFLYPAWMFLSYKIRLVTRHTTSNWTSEFRKPALVFRMEPVMMTACTSWPHSKGITATFTEVVSVESGESNTHSEAENAFKTKINGNLSSKISCLVKHNSDVPESGYL